MNINPYNTLLNHINLNYARKSLSFTLRFNIKLLKLCQFFKKVSVISNFFILKNKKTGFVLIRVHLFYFYGSPIHGFIRQVSTSTKNYCISHRALLLLSQRLGSSVYIVSNDRGLMTHEQALLAKKGGRLVLFIFY